MKNTLMKLLIVSAAAPLLAAAQVPPTPPQGATPKGAPPVASPRSPKPADTPPSPSLFSPKFELEHQLEMMKPHLDELRMRAEEMRFHELAELDVEHLKMQAEKFKDVAKFDVDRLWMEAQSFKHLANVDVENMKFQAEEMAQSMAGMKMDFPGMKFELLGPGGHSSDKVFNSRPPAAWAQQDPADSLYRVAREALNRGEYRRGAQLFSEIHKKYPRSQYAIQSAYWEAFARYRVGGTDDLKEALKILEERGSQLASIRQEGNVDVQALQARIQGALAARGDEKAAEALRKNVAQQGSCDREDVSVRAEALSALGQMDPAAAMPVMKKVLGRRDECTVELRRRALYIVGRQANGEAIPIILDVAKNDTDPGIRGEAMRWLPRVAGDAAVPQLEDMLRTSVDEQTQRSAINALASIDSDRARRAIRAIIERNDAAERVRYDAIISLSKERDGRPASPDDMNYLRSLYGKVESTRLKEAVLTAVSRVDTPENQQFLLSLARNVNETPSLRAAALQRLGRMESVSVAEIAKLYDLADSRAMREQILSALAQRKEPEAIDKMIDIAKKDTDPQIRRAAVNLLGRAAANGNERAKKFLQEIFDK